MASFFNARPQIHTRLVSFFNGHPQILRLRNYSIGLGFCLMEFLLAVARTVLSATMKYAAPATACPFKNISLLIPLVKKVNETIQCFGYKGEKGKKG